MDRDELHKRLCLAIEQQDVLYALVWLRELEQTGDLKGDDDDGLSALLRRNAQHLLELDLHSAADWIDRNLPPHPAPDTLTGFGPLPSAVCGQVQTEPAASSSPESSNTSAAEAAASRTVDPPRDNPPPSRASPGSLRAAKPSVPIQPFPQLRGQRRPIQIHLGELPLDTGLEKVNRLFRDAGVKPCQTFLRRRANKYSAYCHVQHASDYRLASTALHGRVLRGQRLLLERNPPPVEFASDPIVCVRGLPPHMDDSSMRWIARATRCGAWGERIEQRSPASDGRTARGVFRVPSPASAQEAVDHLDGMTLLGREVLADWRFGDEDEGVRRRSAQYERGRDIRRERRRERHTALEEEVRCVSRSRSPRRRETAGTTPPPRGRSRSPARSPPRRAPFATRLARTAFKEDREPDGTDKDSVRDEGDWFQRYEREKVKGGSRVQHWSQ